VRTALVRILRKALQELPEEAAALADTAAPQFMPRRRRA
jgi:hypothetical protein